ncbi:2-hydroxyacid dehydrogenase [Pontibacter mangrovi]|uniref:Glyoxylate/hydroxypyruvate reductase A n=1 Tax=Pontibacter mangrovi TaxID=2589816 RepID=A0A501WGC3_9BACT|nr:glyoxylate/hydroxypyruvate reductase A [Pontibacter mangrovi]TPE46211.1 glyoxylate/hydroxypyruvate reductase A [Pontibacter mangrovi]
MSIVILNQGKDISPWIKALQEARPSLNVEVYPEVSKPEEVTFALAWNHPLGAFNEFPNLRGISSMGAGVDHVLKDPELPAGVPISRITDEDLTNDMANFVLALVLNHTRGLAFYKLQEEKEAWQPRPYRRNEQVTVGVMGLGVLGAAAAEKLRRNGFKVAGWARTAKELEGVQAFAGDEQLDAFLATSDILVCLLPLTPETADILNKETFRKLPQGAFVINVARGQHLVEEDLVEMIDKGHLAGASLDVFRQEPLPKSHVFWQHPAIQVTPHIASVTNPASAVAQVLENYDRVNRDEAPLNVVSLEKGY